MRQRAVFRHAQALPQRGNLLPLPERLEHGGLCALFCLFLAAQKEGAARFAERDRVVVAQADFVRPFARTLNAHGSTPRLQQRIRRVDRILCPRTGIAVLARTAIPVDQGNGSSSVSSHVQKQAFFDAT